MNVDFSKNLVFLRKEKGLTQKKVAMDLEISQALLSHYEKGIRECGLDFVIRSSDYFDVSSDFLLGRTSQRMCPKVIEAVGCGKSPEEKTIGQSISIVFAILEKINSKSLTNESTHYLSAAVYTILRIITNKKSASALFMLDRKLCTAVASSKMSMAKARIRATVDTEELEKSLPALSADSMGRDYPTLAPCVLEMIQTVESDME